MIGELLMYQNKSLRVLNMTGHDNNLLSEGMFEQDMLFKLMNEIRTKSNIRVFAL